MQYDTTKNKIRVLWEESQDVKNDIDKEQVVRTRVNEEKQTLDVSLQSWKRVNSFSTDWETISNNYKQWTIEWDKLPKKLIPFINAEPVFKHSDFSGLNVKTNRIFQIRDTNNDRIKKVRLIISVFIDSDTIYPVSARLMVDIINPEKFI